MTVSHNTVIPKGQLLTATGRIIDGELQNPARQGTGFTFLGYLAAPGRKRTVHHIWSYVDNNPTGSPIVYVGVLRAGTRLDLALSGPSGPQDRFENILYSIEDYAPGTPNDATLNSFTNAELFLDEGDALVAMVAAAGSWTAPGLRVGSVCVVGDPV